MKKLILAAFAACSVIILFAQDETVTQLKKEANRNFIDPKDTATKTWKTGGIFNLNIAQGSLSNWAAGGDKFSLALNTNVNAWAFYTKGKHNWDNMLTLNLGYMNTTSLGTRKNDDRIDLLSKYGYKIAPKWNVGGLFNFRSQMLKGYTFNDDGTKTLTSKFMSPGYVLLSPGFEYKPNKSFSAFLSPATVRWTIVMDDTLSAHGAYGVDSSKHIKTEFGAFASLIYQSNFSKTFSYNGRLDLFSNYLHNPQNVDIYFTNLLAWKISPAFAVTYNFDLIYDDDVRLFGPQKKAARPQLKSMLGIGIMYKFL